VFESLDTPTCAETADVAARTAERIAGIFDKRGRSLEPEMTDSEPHALQLDEPGLSACHDAAARGIDVTGNRAGQPTLRLVVPQDPPTAPSVTDALDEPVATVGVVNLYAKQRRDGAGARSESAIRDLSGGSGVQALLGSGFTMLESLRRPRLLVPLSCRPGVLTVRFALAWLSTPRSGDEHHRAFGGAHAFTRFGIGPLYCQTPSRARLF
jgi:hypothetical protein